MTEKRRRRKRQTIVLEELKKDPTSLLSWGLEDAGLVKLESYRLYEAGYAAADISEALGISREYLHQMWKKFKEEGTPALIDRRWGTEPRKRTPEKEREVLRAKALEPKLGDSELGRRFGMDRSTVYKLLKEHGLQDLHQVLNGGETAGVESEAGSQPREAEGKKTR
ncbi:MAG: hypothetical protein DRJ50_14655 [Actinobacteria bacterium]|nr:MAG: hypothetical protein DRJ50_14655 [Actinomycetota bacterium]